MFILSSIWCHWLRSCSAKLESHLFPPTGSTRWDPKGNETTDKTVSITGRFAQAKRVKRVWGDWDYWMCCSCVLSVWRANCEKHIFVTVIEITQRDTHARIVSFASVAGERRLLCPPSVCQSSEPGRAPCWMRCRGLLCHPSPSEKEKKNTQSMLNSAR